MTLHNCPIRTMAFMVCCLMAFKSGYAACSSPDAQAGSIKYNVAADAIEYCNNADAWGAVGPELRGPISLTGALAEFLSIPPATRRITIMLSNFSTNGTQAGIQLGTTSGYETTGYLGIAGAFTNGNVSRFMNDSQLLPISYGGGAAYTYISTVILTHNGGNAWSVAGSGYASNPHMAVFSGNKALGGVLDRLRVTSAGGSNVFDAGTVAVLIE